MNCSRALLAVWLIVEDDDDVDERGRQELISYLWVIIPMAVVITWLYFVLFDFWAEWYMFLVIVGLWLSIVFYIRCEKIVKFLKNAWGAVKECWFC